MFFAAVEIKSGETAHDAVKAYCYAHHALGVGFNRLKLFGVIDIGSKRFARFASDCGNYSQPVIKHILGLGRGFVAPSKTGYIVFLTDGRTGKIGASQMQALVGIGYGQMYRGPSDPVWEHQFPKE